YTFQTISYSVDVYRRKLEPTQDFVAFASFVSFFPQLVAGPIERAKNLLPQFYKKREFNYTKAVDGLRQILWGLFKKIVIADNAAEIANEVFNNSQDYSGSTLLTGAVFFAFQIYGDFSGYSDIAIGSSRLFGFNLKQNFAFPYFSRDIAEFWRRWHISLSTWFRDYLYIPLGGSRGNTWVKVRNTYVIFLVSGFWHGANWTFVVWGALNAAYFMPLLLTKKNRSNLDMVASEKHFPSMKELSYMLVTFGLTVISWIFFRARDLDHALSYISEIMSRSLLTMPVFVNGEKALITVILTSIFIVVEWIGRRDQFAIASIGLNWSKPLRWFFYFGIATVTLLFGGQKHEFIYFQF
ncbi:MAG: MBOAT family O-acyltransferase, partial [Flavobacteriales bacterium]|nr:MBOAT family O-acyltransferase [Flavobacteriales bacterium]